MYLEPTQEQGRALFASPPPGPLVMLNLLRFREIADYSASPELAPASPIPGAEAYERYVAHTTPFLDEVGSRVLFDGSARAFLIGPPDERWDRALLVEHPSAEVFLRFASHRGYLAGQGHRTAALADSRLLPLSRLG